MKNYDLSKDKIATQSTTYPPSGYNLVTYVAGNAVDRNTRTCMRTDIIGENSPDNTTWWTVDLGVVYTIYSVNILFKNYDGYEVRQQGRFAGFSIYVSSDGTRDNSSLCYKDGPQLPALNFTTTCFMSGRYVTFYNERSHDVTYPNGYVVHPVYTELCEVIVHGCQASGVYGDSCKERCPTNCRDNVCHIQKGTCFGCSPGWMDTICIRKCVGGWYGVDCKQNCSGHCRDNAVCNHVTGQCDKGCAAGWRGHLCDKVCENGTYGFDCVHNCSSNCLNDSPCNKQTGHCERGCKPGYNNLLCDEPCRNGYYGENCSRVCSLNCKTCKPTDGTCSCNAGWMGPNCSIACTKSYGENCQSACSPLCSNRTCDPFNGTCLTSCITEYFDKMCTSEIKADHLDLESNVTAVAVGGTLIALVVLIIVIAMLLIRRKRLTVSSTSSSPYAEIKVRQSEDSTYQPMSVSILDTTICKNAETRRLRKQKGLVPPIPVFQLDII
uniref:Protein draper-like n=1 Tax=Crassostrea virginica TaxID=6565 RepID=A0A8B8BSE6_CRAVI|nr:protein draper-like [Crassostrea virginica]